MRPQRVAACLASALLAVGGATAIAQEPGATATQAQAVADAQAQHAPEADDIQVVQATPGQALRQRFLADNPDARQHTFNGAAAQPQDDGPALRLNRIWVGRNGTLVWVTGLRRPNRPHSAVMRRDTLALAVVGAPAAHLQEFAGAQELRDPRGGSAIAIDEGDEAYLLFGPIDDLLPFRLVHTHDGRTFDYFGTLDPRFRDRYDAAYQAATTPQKMKDFILVYAHKDPDNRVREVFVRLIGLMREQNTFEGYYHAYLLLQEPSDLKQASRLARTSEHKAQIEHMAVATLVDKSRLVDFTLAPARAAVSHGEGGCWMFCKYNFSATLPVKGSVTVRLHPKSPIKLTQGRYRLTLNASVTVPRQEQRRSAWEGDRDGDSTQNWSKPVVIDLHPPHYRNTVEYDLGAANLAFFQRGSAGGYEAHWSTGDPKVTFTYQSMELIE